MPAGHANHPSLSGRLRTKAQAKFKIVYFTTWDNKKPIELGLDEVTTRAEARTAFNNWKELNGKDPWVRIKTAKLIEVKTMKEELVLSS